MASAKPAATTRRTSSRGSGKDGDAEISPARWAGVALVIAAVVGAIVLAMLSPSDPGDAPLAAAGATATATPVPTPDSTVIDTRRPTGRPEILKPSSGVYPEYEIPITVKLADEKLPKRLLALVAFRGAQEVGRKEAPKPGGEATVHARLIPGDNEISVALEGPGGFGPRSETVTLELDTTAPQLAITSPENKTKTYDETVRVTGTSEVGAKVRVSNSASKWDNSETVGPSGEFAFTVPLKRGQNIITATSTDSVQLDHKVSVRVNRQDGRPKVSIKAPKRVKKSTLPANVKFVVTVTDSKGKPMEGARIDYQLGGTGRTSVAETDLTNANGKSNWSPLIERSSSPTDEVVLTLTVTSPYGDEKLVRYPVALD